MISQTTYMNPCWIMLAGTCIEVNTRGADQQPQREIIA